MDRVKRNVIVGQSGGPTAAINSGIQGLLEGRYIDLSEHITNYLDEELLKRTPASYLGSCRFKLPEIHENREVFDQIFAKLDELEIDCFIYIGGNDSMDTIKKLSDYSLLNGSKIRFVGCPKTIDNDLALTDHTPGFGSAAKYIGTSVKEVIRDGLSLETPHGQIVIIEIMGRNAGWLTGSAALAQGEDCPGPDAIYLPELPFDVDKFVEKCRKGLEEKPSLVIAISEGIHTEDGTYISEFGSASDYVDAFGHKMLSGAGRVLANAIGRETGYILSGSGELHYEDSVYDIHSGDGISFSAGAPHVIVNNGDSELKAIWTVTPAQRFNK